MAPTTTWVTKLLVLKVLITPTKALSVMYFGGAAKYFIIRPSVSMDFCSHLFVVLHSLACSCFFYLPLQVVKVSNFSVIFFSLFSSAFPFYSSLCFLLHKSVKYRNPLTAHFLHFLQYFCIFFFSSFSNILPFYSSSFFLLLKFVKFRNSLTSHFLLFLHYFHTFFFS